MEEKNKFSKAIRLAAQNPDIQQGFGDYLYFQKKGIVGYNYQKIFSNKLKETEKFQFCACAAGAALFCGGKKLNKRKMFRPESDDNLYLIDSIIVNFPESQKFFSRRDLKYRIKLLQNSDQNKFSGSDIEDLLDLLLLSHTGRNILAIVISLNDGYKWNFNKIADFVEYLGA